MRLRNVRRFQEGGPMPAEDPEMQGGGGDPMNELMMGAQQAIESQDCNIAMLVCQMLLQLAGGGAAPAGGPAEAPMARRGAKLVSRMSNYQPIFRMR